MSGPHRKQALSDAVVVALCFVTCARNIDRDLRSRLSSSEVGKQDLQKAHEMEIVVTCYGCWDTAEGRRPNVEITEMGETRSSVAGIFTSSAESCVECLRYTSQHLVLQS